MSNDQWTLQGHYFESCTCRDVCPCMHLGTPTEGTCTGLVAWHIDQGQWGDTRLDNLNVALALHTPGAMPDGNWKVVLYLDASGNDAQREALTHIFAGKAGGHPEVLSGFIGEVLGVEVAPIQYQVDNGQVRLELGDTAGAVLNANQGQDGEPVTLHNHPFAVAPGHTAVLATSESLRHRAHGIDLDLGQRSAAYSPFSYAGP